MILDVHRQAPPARHDRAQVDERLEAILRTLFLAPDAFALDIANGWNDHSLFEAAGRHGIEGLLLHAVKSQGCRIPDDVLRDVEQQLTFERLAQSRLVAALVDAWSALERAEIRAAVLKGPVLGSRLYPAKVFRPSSDIDLLVAESDLDRAAEALSGISYQLDANATEAYYRQNHHHVHVRRAHSPTIELHFRLIRAFGVRVPAEQFLDRAIKIEEGTYTDVTVLKSRGRVSVPRAACGESPLPALGLDVRTHGSVPPVGAAELGKPLRRARAHCACFPPSVSRWATCRSTAGSELPLPWLPAVLESRRFRRAESMARSAARARARSAHLVAAKMAFSATLCQGWSERSEFLAEQSRRIIRRQGYRFLRPLVPARWAA